MAYNPFNIFRRNQKVIFAVVTVFIMFVFTLSSGVIGADFFETFTRWLGGKGKKGDAICSIDGTKIYDSQLHEPGRGLSYNRVVANRYMSAAAQFTIADLNKVVQDATTRLSPDARQIITRASGTLGMLAQFGRDPRFAGEIPRIIQDIKRELSQIIESPNMKPDDKEAARAKLASLILMQSAGSGEQYFVFAPNRTNRDLIDFMLWQKKADQLGIKFTMDDVKKLVQREFFGFFNSDSQVLVQKTMKANMASFNMDACLKALGEEFRVREAQVVVLGQDFHGGRGDKTTGGFPLFAPSYEAFEFYRDQCSPTTYAAIPIPAENLVAEVDRRLALPAGNPEKIAEPTDNELQNLFKDGKDYVPNPGLERPAFKIPPKIRLQWLSITGEEPYYLKEAEEKLKQEVLQVNLRSVIDAPLFGGIAALAFNARGFAVDPLTTQGYDTIVIRHRMDQWQQYGSANVTVTGSTFLNPLLDTSVVRPGNLAVAAGGMGAQFLSFGSPLAGVALTAGGPIAYEVRDRVKAGIPLFLGAIPGPAMFNNLMAGEAAYQTMLPKALPMEAYRADLVKNLIAERAKELVFGFEPDSRMASFMMEQRKSTPGELKTFVEEVNKLSDNGKAKDKGAAAQKYIAEFAAKRGLAISENKTLRSEWDLEDDPELAPLVAAQKESLLGTDAHQNAYIPFARHFFTSANPMTGAPTPVTGTFVAQRYPEVGEKAKFLVWRVEETPATPVNYIAAKASVLTEWKRIKARELAKEKAEAMAKEIRDSGKTSDALIMTLTDQAAAFRSKYPGDTKGNARTSEFTIRGVCPLTSIAENPTSQRGFNWLLTSNSPTRNGMVHLFNLPPSENLKYPSNEFGRALLDERTKDPRTVLVLPDAPKDTYYVVTLVKRETKSLELYQLEVVLEASGTTSRPTFGGDTVLRYFRGDGFDKTRRSIMALLKKEFKYEETEEQKKRLDENDKRGGSDEG
jgi:hypothetical protein